jgi:hypothetical protein
MREDRDNDQAEIDALRARIRHVHERGKLAHQRFEAAHAAQDRDGMLRAAEEHAAITREEVALTERVRQRIARRLNRPLDAEGFWARASSGTGR